MTIEEKVYALLSTTGAVTAIVPASRIKPPGNWQNLARPYIVHFPVALTTNYTHGGRAALNGWPYQVSCFADSYSAARALAAAVASALQGNHDGCQFFVRGQTPLFDAEVLVHHIAIDFEVFEAL
jgi:hypothetical protein